MSWNTYKGIQVPSSSTGDAGINLTADLETLADRASPFNVVINPNFDFWQRGTSFSSIANGTYTADRWKYLKNGTMVHTVSQSTSVPTFAQSNAISSYSLELSCTTAQSTISAGNYATITHVVEGNVFRTVAQQEMTLSFWVMASLTGTYCVSFGNSGSDRSYVAEYSISTANTWQQVTITIPASPSAGTWDYFTGSGLVIGWALAVGSTYQATAGSWQSGNYLGSSNQVNACNSTSNTFYLAQVQLTVGTAAPNFQSRSFQEELALCQRYYEKSFPLTTAPADNVTANGAFVVLTGTTNSYQNFPFGRYAVWKRTATPTVTLYNPGASNANKIYDATNATNYPGAVNLLCERGHAAYVNGTSVGAGQLLQVHWSSNAEL